jgi:DNA polymerase I-like protein with 3'-5' exonuclease and polymerase domains
MSEDEAYESVTKWHELYAGYTEWQGQQAMAARESMQVRTATGKLRRLSTDNYYGASANTPVQGSASEVALSALVRLDRGLNPSVDRLITSVHDEIMVETFDNSFDIARVKNTLQQCMINGFLDIFPHGITRGLVEAKSGSNWADAK